MITTFAILNSRGRERLGKMFPESKVPLKSDAASVHVIGGVKDFFYFVDYSLLTSEQRRIVNNYLTRERKIRPDKIDECLRSSPGGQGTIPILATLVDTVYNIGAMVDESRLRSVK
jgi:hypothetical protein